ncbi:uncharacterized protein [Halyomorpha halys]|uniref:uncharacterized protein n=1 Tax=Halyomorpha halys TaxID=286706 RepID=UPI0006D4E548
MFTTIILAIIILWLIYKFWVSNYNYWEEKGIAAVPGRFPFGSDRDLTLLTKFQGDMFLEMFRKFPSSPYFGVYLMRKPTLVIKDPEYIQVVLVKEFSSFKDRLLVKIPESDLLSQHLINVEGDKWKALRKKLSPTFTSGRLKGMFPLFLKTSEDFDTLLQSHVDSVIDVKDLASRFTTYVLCSCAFGLDTNVMESKDSDLIRLGKNILSVNLRLILAMILTTTFPKLAEICQIRVTPEKKESQLFVYNLVKDTVRQREEKNIKRKDFLDLLIQLKNTGTLDDEKEEETGENIPHFDMNMERVAAQCFVFFVAGYETASSVQSFCLYELALNPQIQERVQSEIDRMAQLHAGITYDAVVEMTYLDMVVSETMRKYPTIVNMSRMCTKTVTMPNGDTIEKGQYVFIPIWALHRNPENFPDPDKFDPERFSEENKHTINPYAYIPFGEGPRFCIGKRFGLLQTKMGLISILRKYSVEPCERTQIPLQMSAEVPLTTTTEPIKLKLVKRKLVFYMMWIAIGLSLLAGWLLYKYYISAYDLWKTRGIPYYPSKFPFGSTHKMFTSNKFQGDLHDEMYKKLAPHPLFGFFVIRAPVLHVRDPELIQLILTKEFSHFRDRMNMKLSEKDVLSQNLFNLEGEKWRALRVKLTPTFTSGRMKAMFPLFINCAGAFDSLILSKIGCDVDIKDLVGRLTTDIICNCAFGLDINTINEPDHKLRKIGAEAFKMKFIDQVKMIIIQSMPKLAEKIGARFTPKETEDYILKLVENTIEFREKNNIKRNDFLDLLLQLKNKGTIGDSMKDEVEEQKYQSFEFTVGLMAAQCFVFFLAGFETSSSVQSFCLYELALNQDIQTKVKKEIDEIIEKHGGLTYQAVNEMDYLDMVISETLRKYPTLTLLMRYCSKSITTPYGYKIEAGDTLVIPVWSLHHDPQYFPNPEKFDPERFSAQNRESIKPYTYLPFGEGPRMCIGMRFGQLQTKVGLITILRKCRVEPCAATNIPMVFGKSPMVIAPKDPIVLKLVPQS